MTDYSVVDATTGECRMSPGTTDQPAVFSDYELAIDAYHKLDKIRSANLIKLHDCGCVFRANITDATALKRVPYRGEQNPHFVTVTFKRAHNGWHHMTACAAHRPISAKLSELLAVFPGEGKP